MIINIHCDNVEESDYANSIMDDLELIFDEAKIIVTLDDRKAIID